jgi:lipopolysaccharide export system ATP-binding protein
MKLQAVDLIKQYQGRRVVNELSIEISQGEIIGLLGPNGAGKTTSFYMMVGIVKPNAGDIFLDDKNITSLPMYKRAKLGIGYLPQEASIFRELTVEENLLAPLEMTHLSKKERWEKVEELLEEFSITHIRKSKGKVLSGGERRRTEIARLLTIDPKFVLLDEPFAGVDPIAVEEIQSLIFKLKNRNIGILITDHNVDETLSITDKAYLIFEGKLLQQGTPEDLVADERVKNLYLGSNFQLKRKNTV